MPFSPVEKAQYHYRNIKKIDNLRAPKIILFVKALKDLLLESNQVTQYFSC